MESSLWGSRLPIVVGMGGKMDGRFQNPDFQSSGEREGKLFQCVAGGGRVMRLCRRGGGTRCCRQDDAPSDSGGTIASRTMLQAAVGVPIAWGRGKENELLEELPGSSGSLVKSSVQMIRFRFDCFPI